MDVAARGGELDLFVCLVREVDCLVMSSMWWWLMKLEMMEMVSQMTAGPRRPALLRRTAGPGRLRETALLFKAAAAMMAADAMMEVAILWW